MEVDDAAYQRQSDPKTLRLVRGATRPGEEVEDVWQVMMPRASSEADAETPGVFSTSTAVDSGANIRGPVSKTGFHRRRRRASDRQHSSVQRAVAYRS